MALFRRTKTSICILLAITLFGCSEKGTTYYIVGDIEDPKNEIAQTIARLFSANSNDEMVVVPSSGRISNLDSLEKGVYDFMVTDNFVAYRSQIQSIVPLYPQILHILYKIADTPVDFRSLVLGKKLYAGMEGSSTQLFVQNLLNDFSIPSDSIKFVDVLTLFDADVLFSFTDLVTSTELKDLKEFQLYSLDEMKNLGFGSVAESICLRYPQFEPYVIPKQAYGSFTENPVLTVSNEAILVGRKSLDDDMVYTLSKIIHENKQAFNAISPLLYHGISENFDIQKLSFSIHSGARRYLERDAPTVLERYAELTGVVITIFIALVSGGFTLLKFKKIRKKDKLDVYYEKLLFIRVKIGELTDTKSLTGLNIHIQDIQHETLELMIQEKLIPDESFSIFQQFAQMVAMELKERKLHLASID